MISPKIALNIKNPQIKKQGANTNGIATAETVAPPTDNATPKNIRKTIINGEKRIRRGVMITVSPPKVIVSPAKKGVKSAVSQHISGNNAGIIKTVPIITFHQLLPATIGNKSTAF